MSRLHLKPLVPFSSWTSPSSHAHTAHYIKGRRQGRYLVASALTPLYSFFPPRVLLMEDIKITSFSSQEEGLTFVRCGEDKLCASCGTRASHERPHRHCKRCWITYYCVSHPLVFNDRPADARRRTRNVTSDTGAHTRIGVEGLTSRTRQKPQRTKRSGRLSFAGPRRTKPTSTITP